MDLAIKQTPLAAVAARAQDPEAADKSGIEGALLAGVIRSLDSLPAVGYPPSTFVAWTVPRQLRLRSPRDIAGRAGSKASAPRAGFLLSIVVSAGFIFQADIEEALFGDGLSGGLLPVSAGSIAAAGLWSTGLWFVSPLQLLLLFLGKIETERPSDWFMNIIARANGLPTEDIAYEHPAWVGAAAVVAIIASGCSIAVALDTSLGDATWGVSSGIATCMAAGVYELGRPQRLSADEAIELEEQWQVFGAPSLPTAWESFECLPTATGAWCPHPTVPAPAQLRRTIQP